MKTLLDALIAIFAAKITANTINLKKIYKGLSSIPDQPPVDMFPYLAIDEGGERVEDVSNEQQKRIYSVKFEFACLSFDSEKNIDTILDLSDQIKSTLEEQGNRQKDGHVWGIQIDPFDGQLEDGAKFYYRGRTVIVDYELLEPRYLDY
jgi:hypothetical protein